VAANSIAIGPAWEKTKNAADREPTASSTLRMSSTCSSIGGYCWARSESPVPRGSTTINLVNDATRRRNRAKPGSSQWWSMFENNPGMSTRSIAPLPITW
jgi:hypothetical protein